MTKNTLYPFLYIIIFYLFLTETAMFTVIVPVISTILLAITFKYIIANRSLLEFIKDELSKHSARFYLVAVFFTFSMFIHYRSLFTFIFVEKNSLYLINQTFHLR